jgi:hypothetical protein
MRTRSRPVTAVSASTLRAPIRAARDVRDLPAASWPAPAPLEHVRSGPARIRPAASGSRPRSGLLASIRAGWARLANVPRPRRRSRLSARRPDHPGPRGRVKARSRSPASIRRGSRGSRRCRRRSAAGDYLPRGRDHSGPRRARRGPIEVACLDPTRVAQITNLRRHASRPRLACPASWPWPAASALRPPIEVACLDPAGRADRERASARAAARDCVPGGPDRSSPRRAHRGPDRDRVPRSGRAVQSGTRPARAAVRDILPAARIAVAG